MKVTYMCSFVILSLTARQHDRHSIPLTFADCFQSLLYTTAIHSHIRQIQLDWIHFIDRLFHLLCTLVKSTKDEKYLLASNHAVSTSGRWTTGSSDSKVQSINQAINLSLILSIQSNVLFICSSVVFLWFLVYLIDK